VTLVPPGRPGSAQAEKAFERLLSVQRPVVLAHIRGIRRRSPNATPAQVITILETRYLTAVTTGGAAVGASSVIPAVGVGISLALSAVETAGFLEASALFAQSVTEVHGIAVDEPERARTLVMTMMLGSAGSDLVKQFAGQVTGGKSRGSFWGELVTKSLPEVAVSQIGGRVQQLFVRRFAASQGASVLGRAIPFGVGAVIGGAGNHLLGRKVVTSARTAFGPAPDAFPTELDPAVRLPGAPRPALPRLASRVGTTLGSGVVAGVRSSSSAMRRGRDAVVRRTRRGASAPDDDAT
jgi:hypothetical protein